MSLENLLERMASISPGARIQITGKRYQLNIDEDQITQQLLMLQCFSEVVSEAYELGIEFYCTLGDLCQSGYTVDKVLLLFEVIFPSSLYKSITEDEDFKQFLSSVVYNGASYNNESSILTILEYLAIYNEKTKDIFYDTYVFLQDKMVSTPVFDIYVQSIFEASNTKIDIPQNNETTNSYLDLINRNTNKLLKAADLLFSILKIEDQKDSVYNLIQNYKIVNINADTLTTYSWVFGPNKEEELKIPMAQVLQDKYLTQFRASTPFDEDYFILRKEPVLPQHLYTLVLGKYLVSETRDEFYNSSALCFSRLADINQFSGTTTLLIQKIIASMAQGYNNVNNS